MATSARDKAPLVPGLLQNDAEWKRSFTNWMHQANRGRLCNIGTVTLQANAFSTSVTDARAGVTSFIDFAPETPNAASGATTMYVSAQGKGYFVITHASNAQTDRTFTYTITG